MLLGAPTQDPAPGTADHHAAAPGPVAAAITAGAVGAADRNGTSVAPVPGGSSRAVAVAPPALIPARRRRWPEADSYALVAALVVCGVLGLTLGPLAPLLEQATSIVTGTTP